MVPQHGPFSLHTMLEGSWLPKTAFPTPMIWPLDESQGSSPLQGHGSWLVCEVAVITNHLSKKCLTLKILEAWQRVLFHGLPDIVLRPLHTRAKSCDHGIVRAQRKVSTSVPRHLQNHVQWSRILKCSVKSYVTVPSTECYFNKFLFIWVLTHAKNIIY